MGYKRQSKRKSPFKAYGRSQQNDINFKTLTAAKAEGNRLGKAVGSIGTAIGDAVQTYEANRENKEAASTANPGATEETNKAAAAAFGNVETNVPYNAPNFEAEELPKIGKTTRRPIAPPLKEVAPEPTETGLPNPLSGGTNLYNNPEHKQLPEVQAGQVPAQKSWWEKFKESTGNIVTGAQYSGTTNLSSGQNLGSPVNRTPFKRITPMLRSPFYATAGKKMGELAQSSLTNLSYLGSSGQAGAEGYNSQVDRHNYNQAVKDEQLAELDEEFGELEVAPSGFKAYDASVEGLAREWKGEFVNAKKAWKAGQLSDEDWINAKHRLQGNAASYGKAAANLQQSMKNWIDNKGEISNSTKPETIDFFNTMEKAPDSLTVQNIEGVPTFIGQTLGGKPISMPVDQIANGSAAMRFNTKIDLSKELQPTIKELQGLKTEIDTDRGVGIGNQAWDTPAVQNKVNYSLDKIVNNNAKLRSIAAETYGWDYDQFEERVAADGMDAVKDMVKQELKDDIQESYFPVEKTTKTDQQLRNDQLTGQVKQAQVNAYAKGGGGGTAGERADAGTATAVKNFLGTNPDLTTPQGVSGWNTLLASQGTSIVQNSKGQWGIIKNGKAVGRFDPNDPQANRRLAVLAGVSLGDIDEISPLQRSPFKRIMDYISSPFKQDKDKEKTYSSGQLKKMGFSKGFQKLIKSKYGGNAAQFIRENPGQGRLHPQIVKRILGNDQTAIDQNQNAIDQRYEQGLQDRIKRSGFKSNNIPKPTPAPKQSQEDYYERYRAEHDGRDPGEQASWQFNEYSKQSSQPTQSQSRPQEDYRVDFQTEDYEPVDDYNGTYSTNDSTGVYDVANQYQYASGHMQDDIEEVRNARNSQGGFGTDTHKQDDVWGNNKYANKRDTDPRSSVGSRAKSYEFYKNGKKYFSREENGKVVVYDEFKRKVRN